MRESEKKVDNHDSQSKTRQDNKNKHCLYQKIENRIFIFGGCHSVDAALQSHKKTLNPMTVNSTTAKTISNELER